MPVILSVREDFNLRPALGKKAGELTWKMKTKARRTGPM
jgi:hypothetical protein